MFLAKRFPPSRISFVNLEVFISLPASFLTLNLMSECRHWIPWITWAWTSVTKSSCRFASEFWDILITKVLAQHCSDLQSPPVQIYVPSVLELIEMSPVNSDLQMAALRLLTNLTVTDNHQHLLKNSIMLLLSLLVVSNSGLQVL